MNLRNTITAAAFWVLLGICSVMPRAATAQVSLDLRDADLKSFVQIVAEATGRNFILDPQIRGTVTVITPGEISADAVYEIFLNVLELNRLTIVQGVEADRIVPTSLARELSQSNDATAQGGGFETRAIPVRNVPLDEIVAVVRPLLPQEAVITTVPGSRLLILSDRRENQNRIEALIRQLDQPREQPVEIINLQNANAGDVLQVIQSLEVTPADARLSVDRRSNAILVTGADEFRQRVRNVVAQLDVSQRNISSRVVTLNYADAPAIADVVLRSLSGAAAAGEAADTISIVPDSASNSVLITAPQDRMGDILNLVRTLDKRPQQVLVEAVIFEMSVDGFSDLSAQFGTVVNDAVVGGAQFSLEGRPTLTGLLSTVLAGGTANPGNGGTIGVRRTIGDTTFAAFLSAVATRKSTRLLSTPSIMTLNNQEAEIVVAQNVPFVTGTYSTVGDSAVPDSPFQTIERKDVGLSLNVTPQINADRTVRLLIKQEVSNLTSSSSAAGGEITSRRALSTTVLVRDGNVIMLGGLLEDGSTANSQKVPGLAELPILGGLFRGRNSSENQKVLLVMLRPRVIASDAEARRITQQVAREAKAAGRALKPADDGQFPRNPQGEFPFDGADLNQPFDAGFIDDVARSRSYPPLPSRLKFRSQ